MPKYLVNHHLTHPSGTFDTGDTIRLSAEEADSIIATGSTVITPVAAAPPRVDTPDMSWTLKEMIAFADERGLDLGKPRSKTEALDAITATLAAQADELDDELED